MERANQLVELSAKGEDLVAACAGISREEEEDLKDAVNCVEVSHCLQVLNAWQEETARQFLLKDFWKLVLQDAEIDAQEDPREVLERMMLLDQVEGC